MTDPIATVPVTVSLGHGESVTVQVSLGEAHQLFANFSGGRANAVGLTTIPDMSGTGHIFNWQHVRHVRIGKPDAT